MNPTHHRSTRRSSLVLSLALAFFAWAQAKPAAYECKYFTMILAAGWQASPERAGLVNVLPAGNVSPGLYFKFEGDGRALGTAEASIGEMIRNYNGSPMSETVIAGARFRSTTYTYGGMVQTMQVAFRNGTKITVTIEGKGASDNPDIRAMLKSVHFR
jgi:hypothetical protein